MTRHERDLEEIKDILQERCLVPQIQELSFEVIKEVRQERLSARIVEQNVELPVPQIMEEIVAVATGRERPLRRSRTFSRSAVLSASRSRCDSASRHEGDC